MGNFCDGIPPTSIRETQRVLVFIERQTSSIKELIRNGEFLRCNSTKFCKKKLIETETNKFTAQLKPLLPTYLSLPENNILQKRNSDSPPFIIGNKKLMIDVLVFRSWLCSSPALGPHCIYLFYHSIVCSVISVKKKTKRKLSDCADCYLL